ncbi:LOW QUALITY PROTEIN: site-specific recombinase XerD [Rhizobium leguminosarum bv. trifolii WSM2297]|uniref:Site-specific recombinase XerD n=1 Tax=Rhizobium leguminosarum bv. trifolii WSM2297 TaxID=754762 RepID=J0CLG7_RHILT|nr:LOW QUALITY PROTEIN: site-specific recombinase XerD [Rhizobium leguminosarum bv. trifolii WSM2297]
MFNPVYLVKSRCGVFYLRWPLPKQLHPQKKASTLKLSLQTRDPRKALRLSRSMSQIGERLNEYGIAYGMRYEELRRVLTDHFRRLLNAAKAEMNDTGPLNELDRQAYLTSKLVAKHATKTDTPLSLVQSDDDLLTRFIDEYDLDIQKDSSQYGWLDREMKLSYHGFVKAVLAYDKSLQRYDFEREPTSPTDDAIQAVKAPGMSITEVAAAYSKERQRGNAWAAKTIIEKADHIKLLEEILGGGTDVRMLTAMEAKRVKDTLLAYPRNRSKNPITRGRPLADVLNLPGVQIIQVATINKYLQTYHELFEWAKQNHHTSENFFSGLAVKQTKKNKDGDRDAYTDDQIHLILRTVLHNEDGLVTKPYQKWATLIGIYTGARLGEIAQLHLKDIHQEDGIWVFNMNEEGDRKSLKTSAARRLVPIHSELIEAGLLDYIHGGQEGDKLFPDFSYDPKNGWGRQQSRWFNDRLLVQLGLKSKTRVFHSLRHTVNTRLLQAGVADPLVKSIIGHEQDGMTHRQYFKEGFTLQQRNEAMQKLDYSL